MGDHAVSLQAYAERRFALMGKALSDQFPYCTPIEDLGVERTGEPHGVVSFAHYDYLGISADPRISAAVCEAVECHCAGAGASRLVGGELRLHRLLEREISDFLGVEDTLTLVSGYGANVATVSHLLARDDFLIVDEAAHNSIVLGAQLSRAESASFRHNDLTHLQEILELGRNRHKRVLVVVEGLYSMDGDIPDLPKLIELCRRYRAWLMVDEAHSIGVLGRTGRGICEHFGLDTSEVDLIVGTLSKAFVGCGGFVSAKKSVIDWLRYTMPGFVFSVGMSPPAVATARCALSILRAEPHRLQRLRENSKSFVSLARGFGFNVGTAAGLAVIPILLPDIKTTLAAASAALKAGFFVPPIIQIGVPRDAPRLRFFVTARHQPTEIDGALRALKPFIPSPAIFDGGCEGSTSVPLLNCCTKSP